MPTAASAPCDGESLTDGKPPTPLRLGVAAILAPIAGLEPSPIPRPFPPGPLPGTLFPAGVLPAIPPMRLADGERNGA